MRFETAKVDTAALSEKTATHECEEHGGIPVYAPSNVEGEHGGIESENNDIRAKTIEHRKCFKHFGNALRNIEGENGGME
mgnify:CR=1 FL=1